MVDILIIVPTLLVNFGIFTEKIIDEPQSYLRNLNTSVHGSVVNLTRT